MTCSIHIITQTPKSKANLFSKEKSDSRSLFSLKSIMNNTVNSQKRSKLYVCVVDLRKASNSIWQHDLFP